MVTEFTAPRFCGARFEDHTLPLEVAADLLAYEELIVELAKHLFIMDHPERQRVTRGFARDFHLHLERIDGGSARPVLALVAAATLGLSDGEPDYFEKARDLVVECIASTGPLPEKFPKELLTFFNRFGKSLHAGESIELRDGSLEKVGTLSPERRKELVLAVEKLYHRDVELEGRIARIDFEKNSMSLRLAEGEILQVDLPTAMFLDAQSIAGNDRHRLRVCGVGAFDSWDKLQKMIEVEEVEVLRDYDLSRRLEDLKQLKDGWFDGTGKAPDPKALDDLTTQLIGRFPEKIKIPAVIPTPEGNVLFEWNTESTPSVDFDLGTMQAEYHAFHGEDDIERTFDLSHENNWESFLTFLSRKPCKTKLQQAVRKGVAEGGKEAKEVGPGSRSPTPQARKRVNVETKVDCLQGQCSSE